MAHIFSYIIFSWGHLSRLFGFSILFVFQAARVIGAFCLALASIMWVKRVIQNPKIQLLTAAVILFGSGMGWTLIPFNYLPGDLLISEAYPFLSSLANPHFPLGMALLLWIFYIYDSPKSWIKNMILFDLTFLLSVIMPFGVIIICVVAAIYEIWHWITEKQVDLIKFALTTIGGGAYLLYQYVSIRSDPVLAIWNAQNITKAPPILDFVISFSPALILALIYIWYLRKNGQKPEKNILLIIWVFAGAALLYFPFSLQRRFLFGYYVPVVLLMGMLLEKIKAWARETVSGAKFWYHFCFINYKCNIS